MSWKTDRRQVTLDNKTIVEFESDIDEIEDIGPLLIVILRPLPPQDGELTENVYGLSKQGHIIWQIEAIPQNSSSPVNHYVGVGHYESGYVWIANWNCNFVKVDIETGKIVSCEFRK